MRPLRRLRARDVSSVRDVTLVPPSVPAAANASVESDVVVAGPRIAGVHTGCVSCAGLGGRCPSHGFDFRYPGRQRSEGGNGEREEAGASPRQPPHSCDRTRRPVAARNRDAGYLRRRCIICRACARQVAQFAGGRAGPARRVAPFARGSAGPGPPDPLFATLPRGGCLSSREAGPALGRRPRYLRHFRMGPGRGRPGSPADR